MTAVDVRLATVDGSVTVKVSGRPFGGRVCATTEVGNTRYQINNRRQEIPFFESFRAVRQHLLWPN